MVHRAGFIPLLAHRLRRLIDIFMRLRRAALRTRLTVVGDTPTILGISLLGI
jgi:hypothetical protein